jgi:hypothetical protein
MPVPTYNVSACRRRDQLCRGGKRQRKELFRAIAQDITIVHSPIDKCANPAYGRCVGKLVQADRLESRGFSLPSTQEMNSRANATYPPWPNSIKDYAGNNQGMLAKEPEATSATLEKMWRGTFDLATPLSEQNNEGLCTQDPLYVPWADDVNSSLGAKHYGPNNFRMKVLFESAVRKSLWG